MTQARNQIRDYIGSNPGQHFSAITRSLGLSPGQVQYHVRKLKRRDEILEEQIYGRTHYFPPEYDEQERKAIAVLRRETARDILFHVLEKGMADPATVSDSLGIARSTLEWHLGHLEEQNLVKKQRDEQNRVTLVVPKPEETISLLEDITPSLSDRMTDRFIRLIDSFLE